MNDGDPLFGWDSLEWYTQKCCQIGPTPMIGSILVLYKKLNMDDEWWRPTFQVGQLGVVHLKMLSDWTHPNARG